MLDHFFEDHDAMLEREAVDSLAEHEHFEHHRGDDRVEPSPFDFTIADRPTSRFSRSYLLGPAPETKGSKGAGLSGLNRKEAA